MILGELGDTVTPQLNHTDPFSLPYQQGVDSRIAIKNTEPPGTDREANHLSTLSRALDLRGQTAYQFHTDDEHTDMEAGADWLYPNKRLPANCPSATLGISWPIPSL